jgi:hypothetical protein
MTARQGADLIKQKEGKLCVRYFLRGDGTILTQDCPVGLAAVRKQIFKIAAALVGAFALLGFGCNKEEPKPLTGEPTIQGGADPRQIMGDVAVPPRTNDVPQIMGEICPPQTNAAPTAVMGSPVPAPQTNDASVIVGRPIMGKVAAPAN